MTNTIDMKQRPSTHPHALFCITAKFAVFLGSNGSFSKH